MRSTAGDGPLADARAVNVGGVSDELQVTIAYESGQDGWITAQILEVPAAIDQGRTREEARTNALEALNAALQMWPELRPVAREHETVTVPLAS